MTEDNLRGGPIQCSSCAGRGFVTSWSFGVKEPDECRDCAGSGTNWRYPNGALARYYSGPLIGREKGLQRRVADDTGSEFSNGEDT